MYRCTLFFMISLLVLPLLIGTPVASAAAKTWIGNTTDWGAASNWSPTGSPVTLDDPIIPTSPVGGNFPVMTSGIYAVHNITIQSGASFTITGGTLVAHDITIAAGPPVGTLAQSGGLFQLDHDWKNNGTYTATGGTVQFTDNAGGAADFSTGSNQFFNIIVDAGADPHFDNSSGSSLLIRGNFTNYNNGMNNSDKVTFTLNGTGDQTIFSSSLNNNTTFGYLIVDKASGTAMVTSTVKVEANVTISNGTLDLGPQAFSRVSNGGSLSVGNGGTLKIGGTNTMPTSFTTRTFGLTSTVEYNGVNQVVTPHSYGNLILGGSGTKTFGTGTTTVNTVHSLEGTAVCVLTGTLAYGASATLQYRGSVAQTTGPEFPATFGAGNGVIVDNGNGVTLASTKTLAGTLELTSGVLTTGANTVIVTNTLAGAVSFSSGSIHGEIVRSIGASSTGAFAFTNANTQVVPDGSQGAITVSIRSFPGTTPPNIGGGEAVNRYYTITPSGALNATLRLAYLDPEINAIPELSMVAFHYTGTAWSPLASLPVPPDNYVEAYNVAGYSDFTIGNGDNPLPIQLASFTGTVQNTGDVFLRWVTVSEINNFGFFVQRKHPSDQGFTDVPNSFIPGHGTTNEPQTYTFTDIAPGTGTWMYRLKQVDYNSTVYYTEPITVDVMTGVKESATPVKFALAQNYPNPFNPVTSIDFSLPVGGYTTLKIFNLLGQEVATLVDDVVEAGSHSIQWNASVLPSSAYLGVLSSNGSTEVRKLALIK